MLQPVSYSASNHVEGLLLKFSEERNINDVLSTYRTHPNHMGEGLAIFNPEHHPYVAFQVIVEVKSRPGCVCSTPGSRDTLSTFLTLSLSSKNRKLHLQSICPTKACTPQLGQKATEESRHEMCNYSKPS